MLYDPFLARVRTLLGLLALAIFWIVFALFIIATTAPAARAQSCAPKTSLTPETGVVVGSPFVLAFTDDAAAVWWWCPAPPPPDALAGATYWRGAGYRGLLSGWSKVSGALWRISTVESPWLQYAIERDANQLTPPAGSAQACSITKIEHAACVALSTTPMGPEFPAAVTPQAALDPSRCGPVPTCTAPPPPPPPTTTWRTPASSRTGTLPIYPVVNGKRSSTAIAGRSAPFNAPCDCTKFRETTTAGTVTTTYCALAAGPANECTLCQQVTQ